MTIVVVSPHLDDAILSIGGAIQRLTTSGRRVEILTVFAGDPERSTTPSYWDGRRGCKTAAQATALRREEDRSAALLAGAETRWLPFDDSGYIAIRDPDAIWSAMGDVLESAEDVLIPGFPLTQPDHRWVAGFVLERLTTVTPTLYAELPYATYPSNVARRLVRSRTSPHLEYLLRGQRPSWRQIPMTSRDRRAKALSVSSYSEELAALGFRGNFARISNRVLGKECLGFLDSETARRSVIRSTLDV